jgi:hypothetical protein
MFGRCAVDAMTAIALLGFAALALAAWCLL